MILTGIDIIEISRIKKSIQNPRFIDKIFSEEEQKELLLKKNKRNKIESIAARFCAKEAFAKYLNDVNLDSRQIYFVNQIVEYIVHNGLMKDLSVLQESPFTDKGSVVEVFTDLTVWMGIRKIIEQVNANAIVA